MTLWVPQSPSDGRRLCTTREGGQAIPSPSGLGCCAPFPQTNDCWRSALSMFVPLYRFVDCSVSAQFHMCGELLCGGVTSSFVGGGRPREDSSPSRSIYTGALPCGVLRGPRT